VPGGVDPPDPPAGGPAIGARLIRGLSRLLVRLFYGEIEVAGLDRVPLTGPLLVAANHQNALVDPMLLLATLPRRLRPLAKAPLFSHPLLAPFLRLAGAIPVHRRQDAAASAAAPPERNAPTFRAAADTLAAGLAILIFPEGVSQPEPTLMPLRTGAARMLLEAEAGPRPVGVTLLPVGLVYHEPGLFRGGWAAVLVGPPVPVADCVALAPTEPEQAVRRLTARLDDALRALIVEAGDRETLRLLALAGAIWGGDAATATAGVPRAEELRQLGRAYRYLREREPHRVAALRAGLAAYAGDLPRSGLPLAGLPGSYPSGAVARYALREGAALLVALPLALWGLLVHGAPYRLVGLAARGLAPDPDAEATVKLAAGVVFYPVCWLLEAWLAWRLGGPWLLTAFLVLLAPSGLVALAWQARLRRVRQDTAAFVRFLVDHDLARRLAARRATLRAELEALARLVPR
jgi:glycerol-3-phosphate O-acyltransferase/dihydroxyacetone phosphate acyltransferase